MNPKFPVYIVSKGRWESRNTVKSLEFMKVPYYIIVEEDEYDKYCRVIDKSKILITPQKYNDEYDMFWKDDIKITGAGASRNFAWEHSIEAGFDRHWVLDDNIHEFFRLNRNEKIKVTSGTIFKIMEDFVLRYENIALASPNYTFFCKKTDKLSPFATNTRIYSCILIKNNIPYRWRGRYNEDTDLSLRVLKDGWATVQFNAFLQDKVTTQRMKGGNMEQFYKEDGTYLKSKMLADMHPDVAKVVKRFDRVHHQVDYRPFKDNRLIRNPDVYIPTGINNYGMKIVPLHLY